MPKIAADIFGEATDVPGRSNGATRDYIGYCSEHTGFTRNAIDEPVPSIWTLAALATAIVVMGVLIRQFLGQTAVFVAAAVVLLMEAVSLLRRVALRRRSARFLVRELGDGGEKPAKSPEVLASAKADLFSQVSHELRVPMNAILGMAELLEESELTPEQHRYLGIIRNNGSALLELIDDVLDFSRIGSGELTLEAINFDLRELAERVVETFAIRAHQKGLDISLRIVPEVPVALVGDPLRLRQVLVNLIGNAVKFTDQGEVALTIERASLGGLHFMVADTGIGIPADQRERIFDPYAQASASVAREHGGSGLGLAIVKQITDLMGGRIWVESELNKGSTFHFIASFAEQTRNPAAEARATRLGIAEERVLVAERSPNARTALAEAFEQCGTTVTQVPNGEQALEELDREDGGAKPFRIVLLDCSADPKGFDLEGLVRKTAQGAGMVIPMLTSDNLNFELPRLRRMGLVHQLIKPVRRSELFGVIRSLFGDATAPDAAESAAAPRRLEAEATATPRATTMVDRGGPRAGRIAITEIEPVEQIGGGRVAVEAGLSRPLRILIADDSADNRLLIQAFLKPVVAHVEHAENGEVALAKFTAGLFDVVLMDIQMPVMDGYTAAKLIRQWEVRNRVGPTPIIALTASVLDEAVHKSFEAGCDTHVAKPVRRPTLLAAIHEVTAGGKGAAEAADPDREVPGELERRYATAAAR